MHHGGGTNIDIYGFGLFYFVAWFSIKCRIPVLSSEGGAGSDELGAEPRATPGSFSLPGAVEKLLDLKKIPFL